MKTKLIITFLAFTTIVNAQCPNNLLINGSFSSIKGEFVIAPGWVNGGSTPDINDENGPLNTSETYTWTGVPLASPNDSTWQNIFGSESVEQTVNVISGQSYTLCFEYAAQGINSDSGTSLTFIDPVGLDIFIDDTLSFTTPLDTSQYTWETACYTFTTTTSTVKIRFAPTDYQYIGIDGACLTLDITGITDINQNSIHTISPNPFFEQTTLHINNIIHNGTLTVNNSFGQTVKEIKNISGQTVVLSRDNLANGLYFIRLTEGNKIIAVDKLVIADK
jgi:hypothetical protein